VGHNLSGSSWVHAWHTKVSTNIGVVEVDGLRSSEQGNIFVVNDGVGGEGEGSSSKCGGGSEEGTTVGLGVECGLGCGLCVGCERSGRAVRGMGGGKREVSDDT
jgi:hypothetical protein